MRLGPILHNEIALLRHLSIPVYRRSDGAHKVGDRIFTDRDLDIMLRNQRKARRQREALFLAYFAGAA